MRAFETLHPADDFEFTIRSQVPLSGGLGTSAAAYVAGLMAADSIFELDAPLLRRRDEARGPSRQRRGRADGRLRGLRRHPRGALRVPAGLEAILVVPHKHVRTAKARAAMPAQVPLTDAVHNVGHASMLVLGLAQGDWDLVAPGLHDRLHQPRRSPLYPQSMALVRRAQELGALGATISGAGPSVLFWTHYETTGAVMAKLKPATAGWAQVLHVPFEPQGAYVREL